MITIHDTAPKSGAICGTDKAFVLEVAASLLRLKAPPEPESAARLLRLNREQAAEFLSQIGYDIRPSRLAKMAVTGEGPRYTTWGRSVPYDPIEPVSRARAREARAAADQT